MSNNKKYIVLNISIICLCKLVRMSYAYVRGNSLGSISFYTWIIIHTVSRKSHKGIRACFENMSLVVYNL